MTKKEFIVKLTYDITLHKSLEKLGKFNGKTSGDDEAINIAKTASDYYKAMSKFIDSFPQDMWDDEK